MYCQSHLRARFQVSFRMLDLNWQSKVFFLKFCFSSVFKSAIVGCVRNLRSLNVIFVFSPSFCWAIPSDGLFSERKLMVNFKNRECIFMIVSKSNWMANYWIKFGSFSVSSPPPPQPYWQNYYSPPPLADMLSWAVWFKFLLNKVIANTCLFILTSFSKQSASCKVPEICELCALSTDSRKTYSVSKYMYTGSSSYSFDWGGGE